MVAQLPGNHRGHRLRQAVAGTPSCLGHAVYTMPETLSLFLCNSIGLRGLGLSGASKRSDLECQYA